MMGHGILADLLKVLVCSLPLALAMRRLGQSTIVGYLLTGLVIGPGGLALVHADSIEVLAEIGVGLLLFEIGLELSPARLATMQRVALGGGGLQVAGTALAGALLFWLATGAALEGLFIGCAFALSSSAIVLKTLADRGDLDAPYTAPATAVAIFQDIATVPMMVVLPALAKGGGAAELARPLAGALGRAALLLGVLYLGKRFFIDRFLYFVARARSPEVFVLAVMALILAAAYGSALGGLSLALGAFVSGILLAESIYAHQILADVTPFRGVFQSIFFVSVGMLIEPKWALANGPLVAAVVAALMVGKAAITAIALKAAGVPARVATAAGLVLGQAGEFSFVVIGLGRRLEIVSEDVYQLALAASFASMALAPPLIANVRGALDVLARLPLVGRRIAGAGGAWLEGASPGVAGHVVICGFGPVGRDVATFLLDHGIEFVALDLNPRTVRDLSRSGIPIHYGDYSNPVVLEGAGIAQARALVIAAPDISAAVRACRAARALNPGLEIIARTKYRSQVESIIEAGANEVIEEEFETALEVLARLSRTFALPRSVVADHMSGQRLERYRMGAPARRDGDPQGRVDGEMTDAG